MAILSKEEFLGVLQERIGEDVSEDSLKFIEDVTDTYNDLESKVNTDGEDWKTKYQELDETWKNRYKERFFNQNTSGDEVIRNQIEDVKDDETIKTFDDLFKEREG